MSHFETQINDHPLTLIEATTDLSVPIMCNAAVSDEGKWSTVNQLNSWLLSPSLEGAFLPPQQAAEICT
jgi:hypothetical protein